MATKALDNEIQHYLLQLGREEKKSILSVIKSFAKLRSYESEHISIEQYNKEIDEAMAEIERGEFYTHEEVVKMSKEWTKNGK